MADAGYLTIGKVVKRLQAQYPDLSVSKVRYLEDEGLLTPSRTPGGYRLYSSRDVKRLETILYLQKNRFLPLSVLGPRQGEFTDEQRAQYSQAFEQILHLTDSLRDDLIRRTFADILRKQAPGGQ